MRKRIETRTDMDTGEMKRQLVEIEAVKIGGNWMKTFQNGLETLARAKLRGVTHDVFDYLCAKAGFENTIPSKRKIADGLKLHYPSVSRAFKELTSKGILVEFDDNGLKISPRIYWKGNMSQWESAIKALNDRELKGTLTTIKDEGMK